MEAALLGLRKSYRDACHAKKAAGLFLASLLLLIQVDTTPALASPSGDHVEPIHSLECATDDNSGLSLTAPRPAACKYARSNLAKPTTDESLCASNAFAHCVERRDETLVFFYETSKFATFDLKLRKSRDPPTISRIYGW
jgi:hypothetical protein